MVAVVAAAGTMSLGTGSAALAQADPDCWQWVEPIIGIGDDGNPLYGARQLVYTCGSSGGGSGGGGTHTCHSDAFGTVPCTHSVHGWWSNAEQCYVRLMEPQPAPGDPDWEGNDPAAGAVYQLACPRASMTDFSISPQFIAGAPQLPSPAVLAQQAMESLPLVGAQIGIAPNPDGIGLVGVPVWLWTENTAATWGPLSVSVSVPGLTVTAEANVTRIDWAMGDGTTVTCESPGTPYDASYGGQESPDCGHVYTHPSQSQPDGRYQVTAITTWHAEWWVEPQGSGATGDQFFDRTSSTSVQIHELQVVTS